ncbi:MAG: MFS transporter, partial [Actinomycetes bacterium]
FVLDFFIVNVGLPSIQGGLHASQAAIQWMVAGYGLTLAVTLITAGRIGDMIGRRRAFSVGLGVFAAASAACGVAPSAAVLVVSRLVRGVGAAFISSTVLAIIGVVYTGADRPRAISVYGLVMGVAAAGGQVIGGLLIQADIAGSSWRPIFLINLPVAAAALVLAPAWCPSHAPNAPAASTWSARPC